MKHMTFDDRLEIQIGVMRGDPLWKIAERISKDSTTIRRELVSRRIPVNSSDRHCEKTDVFPYVCSPCKQMSRCTKAKFRYDAKMAQTAYVHTLHTSRAGVAISDAELSFLESKIVPLIRNGVSVLAACRAYENEMPVSAKTVYSYIDRGLLSIRNIDLRQKVRRKYRKKSGPAFRVDKQCHLGRSYADFDSFMGEHPGMHVCEMDSVIGEQGGKALLTILFRNCDLQLMYLRDSNTAASVIQTFEYLRETLGEDYDRLFPVILTDRGTEFSNPKAIEIDPQTGEVRSRIFYCDPMNSNQKAKCERNHELIRYIIPSGASMDNYDQADILKLMNHVNSMPRARFSGKTPIEKFEEQFGTGILEKLSIEKVELTQLCLRPELLKKK